MTVVAARRRQGAPRLHSTVHPRRPDRRRRARHPARLPGGELHPRLGRAAVPADRRVEVRQVPARHRDPRAHRPRHLDEDRARVDDVDRAGEPLRRPEHPARGERAAAHRAHRALGRDGGGAGHPRRVGRRLLPAGSPVMPCRKATIVPVGDALRPWFDARGHGRSEWQACCPARGAVAPRQARAPRARTADARDHARGSRTGSSSTRPPVDRGVVLPRRRRAGRLAAGGRTLRRS